MSAIGFVPMAKKDGWEKIAEFSKQWNSTTVITGEIIGTLPRIENLYADQGSEYCVHFVTDICGKKYGTDDYPSQLVLCHSSQYPTDSPFMILPGFLNTSDYTRFNVDSVVKLVIKPGGGYLGYPMINSDNSSWFSMSFFYMNGDPVYLCPYFNENSSLRQAIVNTGSYVKIAMYKKKIIF